MPASLALILWFLLLLALLAFDPAKDKATSPALWIPIAWMFFEGSRLPAQWLHGDIGTSVQTIEQGNPTDRSVLLLLILLSVAILVSRSFRWSDFLMRNPFLTAFLFFAAFSCIWSDYPLIALKRWFRDLGAYFIVLVVLSDPHPVEALRTVLRRLWYFLIPLSIVLDKYFPGLSRMFDWWTGIGMFVGVTTGKNLLGLDALLSGLFFLWDILCQWPSRQEKRTKRILLVDVLFLAMSLSLLGTANSATCRVCMLIGSVVILVSHTKFSRRHPNLLRVIVPGMFILYVVLALGFGMSAKFAAAVGKDPTLTDRTIIWNIVLNMHTNPLLGTGYESFWMGPRVQKVWSVLPGINEAHDGYLEVYLNLGMVGLLLIVGYLLAAFRTISKRMKPFSTLGSYTLALWAVMLFYCVTEAGFRSGLVWDVFLLATISLPVAEASSTEPVALRAEPAAAPMFRRPVHANLSRGDLHQQADRSPNRGVAWK